MFSTIFSMAVFTVLATAAPSVLEARQPGGVYVAVGNKYSSGGCTDQSLIFADPIFGNGNVCQPLDRFGDDGPINSYKTLSVSQGCSVQIFTGVNCTGTAFSAPVGGCVTGNAPFVSAFVTCPSS